MAFKGVREGVGMQRSQHVPSGAWNGERECSASSSLGNSFGLFSSVQSDGLPNCRAVRG